MLNTATNTNNSRHRDEDFKAAKLQRDYPPVTQFHSFELQRGARLDLLIRTHLEDRSGGRQLPPTPLPTTPGAYGRDSCPPPANPRRRSRKACAPTASTCRSSPPWFTAA